MKLLKLIRWQNLIIIALSLYLVRHFLIEPFYKTQFIQLEMSNIDFAIFVLTLVLISGAGYIINDIFDVNIDVINKPEKQIIGTQITEDKAYLYYYIMNGIAVLSALYIGIKNTSFNLGLILLVPIAVFYFYSLKYKRMFLIGNLAVSFLTGCLIMIVWIYEFLIIRKNGIAFAEGYNIFWTITYFVIAYSVFAFLITLIREFIKDTEDVEGDSKWGCTTLPVVVGVEKSKKAASLLAVFGILLVAAFQYFLRNYNMGYYAAVLMIMVQLPFAYLAVIIWRAKDKKDLHYASNFAKICMLLGILTMTGVYFSLQP